MPQTTTDTTDAADAADTTDGDGPCKQNHLEVGAIGATSTERKEQPTTLEAHGGGQVFEKGALVDITILNGKETVEDQQAATTNTTDTTTTTDTINTNKPEDAVSAPEGEKVRDDENEFEGDDFEFGEFDDYDGGEFWGWYDDLYQFVGDDWDDYFDIDDFESEWEYDEEDDCGDDIDDDFFE